MLQKQSLAPGSLELLKTLLAMPELESFYLVGGTALALLKGHRISLDLDFFTEHEFNQSKLLEQLQNRFNIHAISQEKNTLNLIINGIKVDLIRYHYPLLAPVQVIENIRIFSLKDIAASKLAAITNRGEKKDFFDFYELLKSFSLGEMLQFYTRKYPGMEKFMVLKSLTWFEDAEIDPEPQSLSPLTWDEVKSMVAEEVRKTGG